MLLANNLSFSRNNVNVFKDINLSYDNNDLTFSELNIKKQKNKFLVSGKNNSKNLVFETILDARFFLLIIFPEKPTTQLNGSFSIKPILIANMHP